MKTKSKRRQLFKKKSLIRKHKGGNPELPNNEAEMLDFIKLLIRNNLQNRFEINPKPIRENTISNHNMDSLNRFVNTISEINDLCNPVLEPVFSKGCERVLELIRFINDQSLWNTNKYKSLLIAQFIIINQVFGDGNHRAAIYVLDNYSTYSTHIKHNIMLITERIHKWDGDLKGKNYWRQQPKKEYELYLPNFKKLEEMCKYIFG
jgi:hypothetical protein